MFSKWGWFQKDAVAVAAAADQTAASLENTDCSDVEQDTQLPSTSEVFLSDYYNNIQSQTRYTRLSDYYNNIQSQTRYIRLSDYYNNIQSQTRYISRTIVNSR